MTEGTALLPGCLDFFFVEGGVRLEGVEKEQIYMHEFVQIDAKLVRKLPFIFVWLQTHGNKQHERQICKMIHHSTFKCHTKFQTWRDFLSTLYLLLQSNYFYLFPP